MQHYEPLEKGLKKGVSRKRIHKTARTCPLNLISRHADHLVRGQACIPAFIDFRINVTDLLLSRTILSQLRPLLLDGVDVRI